MNIKTVIVDLDRTLLHTDKTISSYTLSVLDEWKKNGNKIMVATARPLRTCAQFCEIIDVDDIVVANGAKVICENKLIEYKILPESAVRILKILNDVPSLLITLETGEHAYSNKPIAEYETIITDNLVGIVESEGALKIIVSFDSEETLSFIEKILTNDLYCTIANGHLIQIMDKQATKWNGIKTMLDICGCSPLETAYFGDDFDDIEPIKMCGIGIAVSNGIDEVKSVADYVAQSNDDDGVAKFIEQRLLNK